MNSPPILNEPIFVLLSTVGASSVFSTVSFELDWDFLSYSEFLLSLFALLHKNLLKLMLSRFFLIFWFSVSYLQSKITSSELYILESWSALGKKNTAKMTIVSFNGIVLTQIQKCQSKLAENLGKKSSKYADYGWFYCTSKVTYLHF